MGLTNCMVETRLSTTVRELATPFLLPKIFLIELARPTIGLGLQLDHGGFAL